MKKNKKIFIILLVAGILAAAYAVYRFSSPRDEYKPTLNLSEPKFQYEGDLSFISQQNSDTIKTIRIEIAETNRERAQGLMNRSNMNDEQGMLFIFGREQEQQFWMKNTKISLDIIYVNSNMEIVSISPHTTPFSESPIPSFRPAKYVVEVIAGFTDQYNISEGDKITYERISDPS